MGNLKPLQIMANTKLTFYGTKKSKTEKHELFCKLHNNEIIIWTQKSETGYTGPWVHLDKSTAIKFAKTIRTEINKIKGDL